jgi:phytoene dehydrogenase-like protein
MWQKKQTRREFIRMASVAAASMSLGSMIPGCISDKFEDKFAEKGKNPKDYPAVVIGSGLGGLVSAAYLSRAGFPVTVIEQHDVPGGYATAFKRGDFNFDVSLHFFSSPEHIYNELGLADKVERIPLNMTRRIIAENTDITIPALSRQERFESLYKQYPDSKEGLKSYFDLCSGLGEELARFGKNMETSFVFSLFMPFQYPKMWSLRNISFSDLLDKYIKDPKLKNSLSIGISGISGLPPSELSGFMGAIYSGAMSTSKLYYFKSRSQDFSNGFVSIIKDNKGTVIFNKTVNKILTENDRVTGVRTEDGKVYPAKFVVSNANAPDTFGKFLSDNKKAKKYMEELSQYKPSISSFIVWLGLKGDLSKKHPEHSIYIDSGNDVETDFKNYLSCNAEKTPVMLALYDSYFKGYSKPGTSTVTILILSGYEPWRRFEKDYFAGNKKEYNREKMRIAQTLIKRAEKAIPGLSSMIQVMEAATPLTNITYTKNPEGAIYGYPPSVDNSFMNRIKNSTPIKGLYLSSGWGQNPGSYTGGLMNGRNVYRMIMRDI